MYHKPSKRREFIQRITIYSIMTLMVIALVTGLIFIILGYRFDINKGRLEQDALVQFASIPSGANVTIDNKALGSNTPTKSTLPAGAHSFSMNLTDYQPWSKTLTLRAGSLVWLNYALLVPKTLTVQPVATYPTVAFSLSSPQGHSILIQQKATDPAYQLVDLTSDTIKSTTITLPTSLYTDATTDGVSHSFKMTEWDNGGRYVLVQHTYGTNTEWIVLDTQNVANSQNITTTYALVISDIHFAGTSGTSLYSLSTGDVRKIDLSAGTISRALANNVTSFNVYDTNVITYVGTGQTGTNQRVVGVFRDGNNGPYILRTTTSNAKDTSLSVATSHYFGSDYIAIAEGNKVDVLMGNYPSSSTDTKSLKSFASYTLTTPVKTLGFSPNGDYVFTQSDAQFSSYSLEYLQLAQSSLPSSTQSTPLKWLNDNYLWTDQDGKLTIREFDGTNVHTINSVMATQDATLTSNGRYIYSFALGKDGTVVQFQRVRMIL